MARGKANRWEEVAHWSAQLLLLAICVCPSAVAIAIAIATATSVSVQFPDSSFFFPVSGQQLR